MYFNKFPQLAYDFNQNGVIQNVVDIFRHIRPLQNYIDDLSAYTYVTIPDGERPDILSKRIYGTDKYYWTFFIINDHLHDGLSSWPLSLIDLEEYINKEYEGYALETRPNIKRNTDGGITDYENSLAGRFTLGETITGTTSGAKGTLMKKDLYLNQLVVQNVTGNFLGAGDGNTLESITGNRVDSSGNITVDSVTIWKAWKYSEAPHHWYKTGDSKLDKISNPDGTDSYGIESHVSNANFFSVTDDADLNAIIQEGSVAAPLYVSNRNYLFDRNEARSKIRIIAPEFITEFNTRFENLIKI